MHSDFFGDVAQDHGLHGFVAMLQKRSLAGDDAGRYFEQRFIADLETADQPARLLQLRFQYGVFSATTQEICVLLVNRKSRHTGGADFNLPAIINLAYEDVRDD